MTKKQFRGLCPLRNIFILPNCETDHGPHFRYHYSHMSSQNPWPAYSGVKHGDELEFTFGSPLRMPGMYYSKEVSFAFDLNIYWTNFVKTG